MPVDRAGHSFRASRRGLRQCYLATLPFFGLRPRDIPAELQRGADLAPPLASLAPLGRMLVKLWARNWPGFLVELLLRFLKRVGKVIDRPRVTDRLALRRMLKRPDRIEPLMIRDVPFLISEI